MASARSVMLHVLLLALALAAAPAVLSDPPPLQDFCVADLKAATAVDGFPCKAPSTVEDDDFFSEEEKAAVAARSESDEEDSLAGLSRRLAGLLGGDKLAVTPAKVGFLLLCVARYA